MKGTFHKEVHTMSSHVEASGLITCPLLDHHFHKSRQACRAGTVCSRYAYQVPRPDRAIYRAQRHHGSAGFSCKSCGLGVSDLTYTY